jgi:quercetin dioxygenase-like cupin family protein
MRLERLLIVGIVLSVIGVASAQTKAVVWPAAAIKWTDSAAAPGAKLAVLWGDPTTGGYGALKQVPAGTVLAAHTHKNDSHVVMVKGTVTLDIDGKKTPLGQGSYVLIPGGVPHSATCGAGSACEYFEEMSGAFDSSPVKR